MTKDVKKMMTEEQVRKLREHYVSDIKQHVLSMLVVGTLDVVLGNRPCPIELK